MATRGKERKMCSARRKQRNTIPTVDRTTTTIITSITRMIQMTQNSTRLSKIANRTMDSLRTLNLTKTISNRVPDIGLLTI